MDIKVTKFDPKGGDKTRGFVTVICNGMELCLKVRQYKESHVYIEMPLVRYAALKYRPVKWPNQETSNLFQSEVLRQLQEDFNADLSVKPHQEKLKESVDKKNK